MTIKAFKNKLGQTIQPGEGVVMITSGRAGRVNIRTGIYLEDNGNGPVCLWVNKNYWKRTTLPSGRIFLLNTPLAEFK